MTQLYVIQADYLAALKGMEESNLPPECIQDTLDGIVGELTDKLRAVIAYAETCGAEAEMYAARAKALNEHAKARAERADSLRKYALQAMLACNVPEVKCADFTAKIRENQLSVVVDAESEITAEYWIQPPAPEKRIDKKALADKLKAGEVIPGCHGERGKRLDVR